METITGSIPNQSATYEEKKANDWAWAKASTDGYINLASFANNSYKLYLKKLYDYYNGHIDEDDYLTVTEPYGKERGNFPAKIRNFPIIKPKLDLLRGEFAKRPDNFTVVAKNSDVLNSKLEEMNQKLNSSVEQMFFNRLNEIGMETGVESKETKTPEYIKAEQESTWKDKRAINGQRSLNYIKGYNKMEEWYDVGFFDWLVTGEVYSYRGVNHNEPEFEIVNPLDIDYDKDPDLMFIEDADWIVRRKYMHPSSVVSSFYDVLTPEELRQIESHSNTGSDYFIPFSYLQDRTQPFKSYGRLVEVIHTTWKSRKKIGIVSFTDDMGQIQKLEVTEEYKPLKELGETVEWLWVDEAWESYRINRNIYKRIQPVNVQRGSLDNPSKCKLPYNGRIMSNRNSRNVSLVSLGIPYQVFYNIVKYRLEIALAKMKDVIALLDVNAVPKGWDLDKWLYYIDSTGIGFVDYSKEGVRPNSTHQTEINLASKTLLMYRDILVFIEQEWEGVCGITRQREGQISSSETVGGVERAVVQSSLITEIYFRMFDQFKERDYEALLDYSKIAWINGKKTTFVHSDTGELMYLDIDGLEHAETEYGVFVSNSAKDAQKIQQMQSMAQALIQNNYPASAIADMLDNESISQIKQKLKQAEIHMEELATMQSQREQEALQTQKEMQTEALDAEATQKELDRQNKLQVAMISASKGSQGGDTIVENTDPAKMAIEIEKIRLERELAEKQMTVDQKMQEKELAHESKMKEKDLLAKDKDNKTKVQVARLKPKITTKKK